MSIISFIKNKIFNPDLNKFKSLVKSQNISVDFYKDSKEYKSLVNRGYKLIHRELLTKVKHCEKSVTNITIKIPPAPAFDNLRDDLCIVYGSMNSKISSQLSFNDFILDIFIKFKRKGFRCRYYSDSHYSTSFPVCIIFDL